jgi:hypothetical protein
MAVKLNNADNYESIIIIIDKEQYPIAYSNKIEELVEQGCYPTIHDAEKDNPTFEMECELYYDKHSGLFAVESGAVESGTIYSPYSGELCEEFDLD